MIKFIIFSECFKFLGQLEISQVYLGAGPKMNINFLPLIKPFKLEIHTYKLQSNICRRLISNPIYILFNRVIYLNEIYSASI